MFTLLNMRSGDAQEDLSTRARIRGAAIAQFGEHGFDRTTMRMIAQAAGVSAALVVHHFGDKQRLRQACDAHVVAEFTDPRSAYDASPSMESIQAALADLDAYGPALAYLTRMLVEDSTVADSLFDGILAGTERMLRDQQETGEIRPQSDLEGSALLLTLIGLGPLVMRRQFARALGQEELTPDALMRVSVPMMELFTHGLYTDDSLLRATAAAVQPDSEEH